MLLNKKIISIILLFICVTFLFSKRENLYLPKNTEAPSLKTNSIEVYSGDTLYVDAPHLVCKSKIYSKMSGIPTLLFWSTVTDKYVWIGYDYTGYYIYISTSVELKKGATVDGRNISKMICDVEGNGQTSWFFIVGSTVCPKVTTGTATTTYINLPVTNIKNVLVVPVGKHYDTTYLYEIYNTSFAIVNTDTVNDVTVNWLTVAL